MIKIAYIVQCHKNPKQVDALISSLLYQENDVYVHIDKKTPNCEMPIAAREHLYILPEEDRLSVKWGQISQVDATLKLIQTVINTEIRKIY